MNIDPDAMARIKTYGGDDMLAELLEIYQRDMPRRLAQARQALAEKHGEQVADLAHAMRSSAGNLGVNDLVDLTQRVERQARQNRLQGLDEQLAALESLYLQSVEILNHLEL